MSVLKFWTLTIRRNSQCQIYRMEYNLKEKRGPRVEDEKLVLAKWLQSILKVHFRVKGIFKQKEILK